MPATGRPDFEVFDPAGAPGHPTPRRTTLRGARLALIDNGKRFPDTAIDAIGTVLKRGAGVKEIRLFGTASPRVLPVTSTRPSPM